MGEKQLNERALELRREYQREWRRKNKEKVRANNLRYWERKAQNPPRKGRCSDGKTGAFGRLCTRSGPATGSK